MADCSNCEHFDPKYSRSGECTLDYTEHDNDDVCNAWKKKKED